MKGVILAGGSGSRLHPLTAVTNKHLLPVYNKPLIYFPIEKLVEAGVTDILIVTSGEYMSHFTSLLDNGSGLGARLRYAVQLAPNGLADALRLAKDFAQGEKIIMVLGDNVFEDSLKEPVQAFQKMKGAAIFLKEHPEARDYGVVEMKDGKVIDIEEKPVAPKSNWCAVGIYMYNPDVFDVIDTLKPSKRGEYEITDVNRVYLERGELSYFKLKGEWFDCGNFYWLLKANLFVAKKYHNFDSGNA